MVNKNSKTHSVYKQLSILIAQDGFLFYLKHQDTELSKSLEGLFVKNVEDATSLKLFKKRLKNISYQFEFKSIKVAFADANYTLVPKYYYKEDYKADFLKYNVQLFEEDQIVTDYVEKIDIYQVYIPLMNYHNEILEQVNEFEYEHFTNTLITYSKSKSFDFKQKLNVFLRQNSLDIIAFEGQTFKLCNTFYFETDYDLVYYILFAVEELKFDQKQMQLNICHNLDETLWLDILKRYILNIKCEQKDLAALIV